MPLILLAEDESSTIDLVRSALSSQGWLVKTVGNRDQALRAASEFAPQLVLVADCLAGAEDLIRTFSRRQGGPGVIVLRSEDGGEAESAAASPDVDSILVKPLNTGDLIETIRQGLVDGRDKPPAPPVVDTQQVLSSQEIFGDLLDDILDPEAEEAASSPEPVVEAKPKKRKPKKQTEPVIDIAAADETIEEPKPSIEKAPEIVPAAQAEQAEIITVASLEDLEEVVREGVEAWADSRRSEDTEESHAEELAEAAVAEVQLEPEPDPDPDPEEDLDSKLEDTLAGVLADSLSQAKTPEAPPEPQSEESDTVDALLSQALGDLHLDGTMTTSAADEAAETKIDDEIEALAASVEIEPIPEMEQLDLASDLEELAGVPKTPEPVDIDTELEEVEEAEPEIEDEVSVEAAADLFGEELESLEEIAVPTVAAAEGIEFGEYTLEQQIGVGGMASVWKARRKGVEGFEKRVAIKKILPQAAENEDFVEMFIDEAKLAAQLNHSNITHIYDLGKIGDDYFIAMEYVEGKNLRQILDKTRKEQKPVPVGVALFVASQIADALDYAHRSRDFDDAELGLVHRDVSPQNVLISFEGDIKLCDFGIAKAVSKISTTQMGALKGKLQYMSPEQAWGKAIDHRSDLFSLGSLLYEMLTGERLFSGESEMAVLEAVREADVGTQIIQSPDIPAGVKGVLLRSLAKEPEDRFESAADLQRGLEELVKEESPAPGPRTLSAFVRELLGLQAEPPEPIEDQEPAPQIEVAEDLEWDPDSLPTDSDEKDEDEDETTPWLRRILTRLLPVILVIAVGGGIIAGLMQREAPVAQPATEETTPVTEPPTLEPADAEDAVVDPQGQPPPTQVAASPTPAPPAKPQPQEPKSDPVPAQQPPSADVEPKKPATVPAKEASPAATDPELERQVKEDLQRVEELMGAPTGGQEAARSEAATDQPPAEEPLTLASLWSDVTAAEETGDDSKTPVQPGDPVQPGPGVVEPRMLEFEQPEYTEAARQAGVEGTIRVSVLVGEDGRALEVRLIQGLDSQVGLEEALIEAAHNAEYQPASKDGTPVRMWYQVAVPFRP